MSRNVDQDLLRSFAIEANSYLPEIVRGVADFHNDPREIESLEKAYRHSRTIKGASSMIGLSILSEGAALLEEILDNIAAGWIVLDEDALATISDAVVRIGAFLEHTAIASRMISTPLTEQWKLCAICSDPRIGIVPPSRSQSRRPRMDMFRS